jgi:hypothetical protein
VSADQVTEEGELPCSLDHARGLTLKNRYRQPRIQWARANGFKTYIVSGGGIEFMRPWTERVYSIPPEQVVGSSIRTKFELRDGKPVRIRLPEIGFIDDTEFSPPRMRWVAESRGGEKLAESDWGMAC